MTPFGCEVIAAEGNPLYSHSYLFGYAIPFTHTGVKFNYVWNSQWSTYFAVVNGWAAGGGHSLHVVCDLTIASREHAKFKQTDADVGSFDGGYGSAYLARQVGQKFAREVFFLGRTYTAEQMHHMGAVNEVVDHAELERVGAQWAAEINAKSPQAQRMLKFAFNLLDDGLVGQQLFAGEATRLAYMTDEVVEGRDAFLEKRPPDWSPFPRYF